MNTPTTPRRVRRAVAAIAVAVGLVASSATVATASTPTFADEPAPEPGRSSFTLPVLPDTQFYSRYSQSQFYPKYGTNPFEVQTKWLVENQDALNIPFVAHVGDVVDQNWVTSEWDAGEKAMRFLTDGGLPYSVLPGNHDTENMGARSSEANSWYYLQKFNASKMAAQGGETFVDSYQNGLSTAYIFEAEGYSWMSLALAWNASADTFGWAQRVIDAHPGIPVILTSHAIINIADDQTSPADWAWGEELWNALIAKNDEIIVTVNGHFHGTTMRERTNDYGNPVYQVLTDYQMAADGGNGYLTTFEFDLTNDRIDVESVSPWITVKDEGSLTANDTPYLEGTWQSFSLDLDFGERFGYDADAAYEVQPDLSELAKAIVSEGWDGSAGGGAMAAAGGADDYIAVEGTVAHWRFGQVTEGVVDENSVIPDVAGDSPMYRSAIEHTDAPEALEDVTVSHSNVPYYAADAGAICFADVHRNDSGPDNLSYISTEYGAPATFADLNSSTGYTVETFLQLDENWTETYNRWGAALTRGGARAWMGINDSADPGAGAAWLGISSLREYQFSAGDSDRANSYTLWSGEIMQGAWHHVAIVNDPIAGTAILYVDGVPVLRNASNVGGMMAADFMPWIIGASTWNTEPDHGWHGCVGETRVVDHALATSEFLTQRVDIDGAGANFAVATDLATVYAHDHELTEISGSGHAGASIRVERAGATIGGAEVGADGVWRVVLDDAIAGPGSYDLSIVQSIGTRDGAAYQATLVISEAPEPWKPSAEDLVASLEGMVTVTPNPFAPGDTVTIELPVGHEGDEVYTFVFSDPTALGGATVAADATLSVDIPTSMALGEHRVGVYSADGSLIGWQSVSVTAADVDTGTGTDVGTGDSDGGSASGGDAASEDGALAVTGGTLAGLVVLMILASAAIMAGVMLRPRHQH